MAEELILKPFQEPWIEEVREARRRYKNVCAQAPTGFGKTTCFTYMLGRSYQRGHRALVITHLNIILEQISERLNKYGVPHDFVASGYPRGHELIKLCVVDTLNNRLDEVEPPNWAVEDECHLAVSPKWKRVRKAFPNTRFLGTTATTHRLDQQPLSLGYDCLVPGPQPAELIAAGQLVPSIIFAPPNDLDLTGISSVDSAEKEVQEALRKSRIFGKAAREYKERCPGARAVVFNHNLEAAAETVEEFQKEGFTAAVIDGSMNSKQRKHLIQAFESGSINVLCTVNLLLVGVDIPGIEVIIWLRPTSSEVVWIQGNGRGMRAADGKSYLLIHDHVGNVFKHGKPEMDRHWTLDRQRSARKKEAKAIEEEVKATVKRCEACSAVFFTGRICPQCGTEVSVKEREIITVDGQLVILADNEKLQQLLMKEKRKEKIRIGLGRAKRLIDFQVLAQELGYSPEWAMQAFLRRKAKMNRVKL